MSLLPVAVYWMLSRRRDEIATASLWTCRATNFMGPSRGGLLPKKPKELLPLPPRQRLQQRPHQSLDLYLTVFLSSRLAHFREPIAAY
jgi:hypothetical protein